MTRIESIGERQLGNLKDLGKSLAKMQTVTEVYQNAAEGFEEQPERFSFCSFV